MKGSRKRIARRLIISVVLFSSFITILTSSYQLYLDFNRDVHLVESRLDEIKYVHTKSLSSALWTANIDDIYVQLEGILNLTDIKYLKVYDDDKLSLSVGKELKERMLSRDYKIFYSYRDKNIQLGTLYVEASLENAFHNMVTSIWKILISNGIKTFLVTFFILYVFNKLVTKHLEKISAYAKGMSLLNLDEKLALDRNPHKENNQDELDDIVSAIDLMRKNIKEYFNELKDSEQRVRLLMNSTAEAIYGVDNEGNCIFANPACVRILGYDTDDELLGQNMHCLIHHAKLNGSPCIKEECLINSTSRQGVLAHVDDEIFWRKDGSSFPIEYWSHPFSNENGIKGCVVTFFDITQRRQTEDNLKHYREHLEEMVEERTRQLEASNQDLEAYSYSIAHDLRSPLRAIVSFSQIVEKDAKEKLDHDELESLARIIKAGKYMETLIDAILDHSRINRREINKTSIDISEIAGKVVSQIENSHNSRKVHWKIQHDLHAYGDPILLNVLMDNLIGNAWKFTSKERSPCIEVGMKNIDNENVFYVKDNGVGFDMNYADKLFGVFQRLHTKTDFIGTGVGLATVQRIIQRHDGRVWAESETNKGAIFFFTLGNEKY